MIFIKKKVAGVVLVLLGGLMTAHGGSTGQMWETLLGLLVAMIGAGLLVAKIVRRNDPAGRADY
jgi:hypothetical protein